MSDTPARKKSRWGRRILFFVLLLGIAWVATVLWLSSVGSSRLEAELAQVRDAGEPLAPVELAPPRLADADNAAPLLLEAFDLLVEEPDAWHQGTQLEAYESDPFGQDDEWYEQLEAWVERNAAALERAREAGARSGCRFDLQWEQGIQMESPQVWGLLTISRLLCARAILATRDGEIDGAIATCADVIRLAEIGLQDPLLIYLLVRAAIVDQALVTAQEVLTQGRAATGALQNLLSRLSALPGRADLHRALVGERAFVYSAYDLVLGDPAQRDYMESIDWQSDLGRNLLLRLIPNTVLKLDGAHCLSLMRRTIELAKRPYREVRADWMAFEGDLHDRPWYAVLSPVVFSSFPTIVRQWATHEARTDVARLGLHLELHVREHGTLPATYADLDVVLSQDDPFRNAPYVLETEGDGGWRVYSVGPDGQDDGGRPLDDDRKGDVVWRMAPAP